MNWDLSSLVFYFYNNFLPDFTFLLLVNSNYGGMSKQTMRIASAFCVGGWLAIYFAEVGVIYLLKNILTVKNS